MARSRSLRQILRDEVKQFRSANKRIADDFKEGRVLNKKVKSAKTPEAKANVLLKHGRKK